MVLICNSEFPTPPAITVQSKLFAALPIMIPAGPKWYEKVL